MVSPQCFSLSSLTSSFYIFFSSHRGTISSKEWTSWPLDPLSGPNKSQIKTDLQCKVLTLFIKSVLDFFVQPELLFIPPKLLNFLLLALSNPWDRTLGTTLQPTTSVPLLDRIWCAVSQMLPQVTERRRQKREENESDDDNNRAMSLYQALHRELLVF